MTPPPPAPWSWDALWSGFTTLYNSNTTVQLLTITAFWGLIWLVFSQAYKNRKAKELAQPKGPHLAVTSGEDSYWKEKKELYDRLRKATRDMITGIFGQLYSEFVARALQLGIPQDTIFSWEETLEWEAFFHQLGSLITGRLFEDLEENGFENVGDKALDEEKAIVEFVEGKVTLHHTAIHQALISIFQREVLYRKDPNVFKPRTRLMTYGDLSLILSKVQPDLDSGVRKLYQEAVTSSKALWKEHQKLSSPAENED